MRRRLRREAGPLPQRWGQMLCDHLPGKLEKEFLEEWEAGKKKKPHLGLSFYKEDQRREKEQCDLWQCHCPHAGTLIRSFPTSVSPPSWYKRLLLFPFQILSRPPHQAINSRRKPQGARSLADTIYEQFLLRLIIYLRGRIRRIKGTLGDYSSYTDNPLTFNEVE